MPAEASLAVEPMSEDDVPAVYQIDREISPTPWPRTTYYSELSAKSRATYIVLRLGGEVVGYGGMWRLYDEAHVTTIGVSGKHQGKGYGRVLFAALVQKAYDLGAKWVTLEVRISNHAAIRLYESFSFKVIGRRQRYYTDIGEDALVMWSDSIYTARFRDVLKDNLAKIPARVEGLRSADGEEG